MDPKPGASKDFDFLNTDDFRIGPPQQEERKHDPDEEHKVQNLDFSQAPLMDADSDGLSADPIAEPIEKKKKAKPKKNHEAESTTHTRAILAGEVPQPEVEYDDEDDDEEEDEKGKQTILDQFLENQEQISPPQSVRKESAPGGRPHKALEPHKQPSSSNALDLKRKGTTQVSNRIDQEEKLDDILNQLSLLTPSKFPDQIKAEEDAFRQLRTENPDSLMQASRFSKITLTNNPGTKGSGNHSDRAARHSFLVEIEEKDREVKIEPTDNEDTKKAKKSKLSKILVDHYITNQKTKTIKQEEKIKRKLISGNEEDSSIGEPQGSNQDSWAKSPKVDYPVGFTADDDLDGDGIIDPLESQIKVECRKQEIQTHVDTQIKRAYYQKFRKEVDFHHKIAYKFERAYQLGKKNPDKQQDLDMEIIDLLSDYSDYVQHDPLVLFYCLFFCIFFNNSFLVEFIRNLICKIVIRNQDTRKKFDLLLDYIDTHGLERTRTVGEAINTRVYHMTFYQAIEDKLRVVYSKILRKLKQIQLRNKDALLLLNTRDYKLIKECFDKQVTKLTLPLYEVKNPISHSYKQYNPAYFEEILLEPDSDIEKRVARNYRERFLIDREAKYQVLLMYSKKDYMNYFLEMEDVDDLSHAQIIQLFQTCLKHDAFKLALQLYSRFMRVTDMTPEILQRIITCTKESVKFLEIKLFFLHEHFDVLDVEAMNRLLDVFIEIFARNQYHLNPLINCYNTVKVSLLVFKVTYRIEQMNIYALITKCQLLNKYLEDSLNSFLHLQSNVGQLNNFMLEPILNLKRQQDSLDIMLEMNMETILNHPVIIEVLNLVYEGKYSVDSSLLYLSQTFALFFNSGFFDPKSLHSRLRQNIQSLNDDASSDTRQASLQYNIWKYCIQQRLLDETFFVFVSWAILFYQSFVVENTMADLVEFQDYIFGEHMMLTPDALATKDPNTVAMYCPQAMDTLLLFQSQLQGLTFHFAILLITMTTSVVQKLTILRVKSNAEIDWILFLFEAFSAIFCLLFLIKTGNALEDARLIDPCRSAVAMTDSEAGSLAQTAYLVGDTGDWNSWAVVLSCNILIQTLYAIYQLKRTQQFGYIVIMIQEMLGELGKYFTTFGLVLFFFFAGLRMMTSYFKQDHFEMYDSAVDTLNLFVGVTELVSFTYPSGQIYMLAAAFLSKLFLFSFMIAMFVLRYYHVWQNIEATRRIDVIKLKNTQQFDPMYGCITMSYFPINVFLLPFMIPILLIQSDRLNQSVLQLQYLLLVILYLLIALVIAVPILPLLLIKMWVNSVYIYVSKARSRSSGKDKALVFLKMLGEVGSAPFLAFASLFVDILALNGALMKDEKHFEFKYQKNVVLEPKMAFAVTKNFMRLFIINFEKKYKGMTKTEFSLMFQHRNIFNIVDLFHSVFCKGDKTYDDAVQDIKVYNLTKVLGSMCSIPSKMGIKKYDCLHYNVMAAIFDDQIMFNYYLQVVSHFDEELNKAALLKVAYPYLNYDQKMHNYCQTLIRDYSEVFNYFAINSVTKAYTDVRDIAKQYQIETNFIEEKKQALQIDRMREAWNASLVRQVDKIAWQMSDMIQNLVYNRFTAKQSQDIEDMKSVRKMNQSRRASEIHDAFTDSLVNEPMQ